jgi:hypothetical protein
MSRKIEIYRAFFLFVVAYSTFTVLYTSWLFVVAGTFDIETFLIRIIALSFIWIMFFMFLDITNRTKFYTKV